MEFYKLDYFLKGDENTTVCSSDVTNKEYTDIINVAQIVSVSGKKETTYALTEGGNKISFYVVNMVNGVQYFIKKESQHNLISFLDQFIKFN